mmetsp:Transcript_15234/g.49627  ORF Transcript_15234/g.49627 Transcript_15234/m.49627 type:complete len:304 (-) Transcript_15234:173-1084(-)
MDTDMDMDTPQDQRMTQVLKWADRSEEECVVEVLRRSKECSAFRADRLRLPVKPVERLASGDTLQCFHDRRTGFHDWIRVTQRRAWCVELIEWREREDRTAPPVLRSLGDVLDEYAELRINAKRATLRKKKEPQPYVVDDPRAFDASWIDEPNDVCFQELARRCAAYASWGLRFRLPSTVARPAPGCTLQLFHDRLTGFATYGTLMFDDTDTRTHFVRIYSDHAQSPKSQRNQAIKATAGRFLGYGGPRDADGGGRPRDADGVPLPYVDIPIGIVLDQHAELRVYAAAPPCSPSLSRDMADDE